MVDNIWSHKHLANPRCNTCWCSKGNSLCACVCASSMSLCLCILCELDLCAFPYLIYLCVFAVGVHGCWCIPVGLNSSCAPWPLPHSDNIHVSFATVYRWLTYPVHERAYICCSKRAVSDWKVLCRKASDASYTSGRSHSDLFRVKRDRNWIVRVDDNRSYTGNSQK